MEYKKAIIATILLLNLGLTSINNQYAFAFLSGAPGGCCGSISFPAEQFVYTKNKTNCEKQEEPPFVFIDTGKNERPDIILMMSGYPHPSSDFIILKLGKPRFLQRLIYYIYDTHGVPIGSGQIFNPDTSIPLEDKTKRTYYLRVYVQHTKMRFYKNIPTGYTYDEDTLIKTFKIIKN